MPNVRYERIIRYVQEMPWAIRPEALGAILDILEFRANGGILSDEEMNSRLDGRQEDRSETRRGKVAIIPLFGTIFPRANLFTDFSGGTSLQKFSAALTEADRDPEIASIIIDVASPGGSVDLLPETAEVMRGLSTPTVAVANTQAASAAYWLASQADEVVVSPSAEVGSIGVFTAHQDISGMEEKIGARTTLISSGKYKTEGHPFGPLDPTARKAIQAKVDHYYGLFVADVARGRGVSPTAVRNGFGEGRMVTAADAVREGMADRVATLAQIVSERSDGSAPVAIAASAAVRDYFADPSFGVPGSDDRLRYDPGTDKWSCPVTVNGDHIFGHVAPMGVCLRGQPHRCLTPPEGDLEGFMRGYAPGASGLRTGVIVLGGAHADVGIGVIEATKHYDKTGRAGADVRVGRDAYGIWFSGMIRPGLSKDDRYALAASDVSGHWEPDQRGMPTLVGLPAVNVGGYPKGYLTAAEVNSGIAAAATIEAGDCFEADAETPCMESRVAALEDAFLSML